MADLGYWGSATFGGALVAAGAWLGRFIVSRTKRADEAKDETLVTLRESLAVSTARATRAEDSLLRLGERHDALVTLRENELQQIAGVAYRIKQDSQVDNAFAEDMPTAVRDRAELIAPKSVPPKLADQRSQLRAGGEGRLEYDERRRRQRESGDDTPTAFKPKALSEPFPRYQGKLVPNDDPEG